MTADLRCVKRKDAVNEQPPCNTANGGHANPTVGDPIVLRTGANLQSATDFETADGRLQLGRSYRSQESALKGYLSSYTFASHGDAGRFWRSNYFMKFEFHEYFEQSSTQYRTVTVSVASGITYQPFSTQLATLGHGNGLTQTRSYTLNGELDGLTLKDGGVTLLSRTHAWADGLNLTGISDAVAPGNTQAFAYSAANRLQSSSGPWGSLGYSYDATGNRTQELVTPAAGAPETRDTSLAAGSNRIASVTGSGAAARSFTHDAAGNMLTDMRGGTAYAYSYNAAGRLASLQVGGVTRGSYVYDGNEQLITRTFSEPGLPAATVHTVHDARGNLVVEIDAAGAAQREYLWLPEAGFAGTDLALAVIDAAPPAAGVLYHVHGDHLGRPVRITDAARASVWDAVWTPWGAPHAVTGTLAQTARFPGQWFQVESGLAYNWHRHYEPSLGRYTQPDPLGFVDGPNVYAYVRGNPENFIDILGLAGGPPGGRPNIPPNVKGLPPATPPGTPGVQQPEPLPPKPPGGSKKAMCDAILTRCIDKCRKACERIPRFGKIASGACQGFCWMQYAACVGTSLGDE